MLENPDGRDFDNSVERLAQLPSDQVESLAAKYGDKIRKLVGSKSPEARLAAVQALAKARDLDNVETLIYALTDPDYRVVRRQRWFAADTASADDRCASRQLLRGRPSSFSGKMEGLVSDDSAECGSEVLTGVSFLRLALI